MNTSSSSSKCGVTLVINNKQKKEMPSKLQRKILLTKSLERNFSKRFTNKGQIEKKNILDHTDIHKGAE